MATTFSEIVKAATVIIDDVRDREQLSLNPAVFYRRYAGYVETALPLLSRPPELYAYLRDNVDSDGYATPYTDFTYNSETGYITFGVQPEEGIIYDADFYTDGYFNADLTPAQIRLFALAISVVWNERFENDWLNIQPKVKDNSFKTANEPGFISKVTERQLQYRQRFSDELRKYEQDVAYLGFPLAHGNEVRTMFNTGFHKG